MHRPRSFGRPDLKSKSIHNRPVIAHLLVGLGATGKPLDSAGEDYCAAVMSCQEPTSPAFSGV